MDLLRKARDLESKLAGTFDRTVGEFVRSGTRDPIEIVDAITEAALAEIQSSGRGRRVFPFTSVSVTILAASRDARARFEAVFNDGLPLRDRILAELASASCRIDHLDVSVNYESRPRKHWRHPEFHVEFARMPTPARQDSAAELTPPRVEVTVLRGTAVRRTYAFAASQRIDLGRCADVRDSRHRLIRTNHVAFLERSGDVNQTVSRRHAHISYEPAARSFRLYDDGSEHGTGVVRHGRTLTVPRGARGVRLEPGDEIALGDARVRISFVRDERQSGAVPGRSR